MTKDELKDAIRSCLMELVPASNFNIKNKSLEPPTDMDDDEMGEDQWFDGEQEIDPQDDLDEEKERDYKKIAFIAEAGEEIK